MILHGHPVSNYVNIVRVALIEKGVPHEFRVAGASQDAAFLAINPMGKIPVLETSRGPLAETVAILDYLDDASPEAPLRPTDPYTRAQGRQIVNVVQSYVEATIRSLFPGTFFGGDNPPAVVDAARPMLQRAADALGRLMAPRPFLLGEHLAQADIAAFFHLDIAERVTRFVYDWSIRDAIGGLEDWDALMRGRASVDLALADFDIAFAAYLTAKGAAYRPGAREELLSHA